MMLKRNHETRGSSASFPTGVTHSAGPCARTFKTLEVLPGRIVRTVELIFKSSTAVAVWLIGDFTCDRLARLPLRQIRKGIWQIQLILTPGRYRYQFIVDRRWLNDPRACAIHPRRFGSVQCVLRVE